MVRFPLSCSIDWNVLHSFARFQSAFLCVTVVCSFGLKGGLKEFQGIERWLERVPGSLGESQKEGQEGLASLLTIVVPSVHLQSQ